MNENPSNSPTPPEPEQPGSDTFHNEPSRMSEPAQPASFDPAAVPPRPDLPQGWTSPNSAPHAPYGQTPLENSGHAHQTGAFGQPQPQMTPQGALYAPYGAEAASGGHGNGGDSGNGEHGHDGQNSGKARKPKRASAGLLVACLAIGAIVGGASGAGAFAVIDSMQQGTPVSNSAGNSSVTINNNDDVTMTTAIAAKAAPSVVTISVRGTEAAGSGSGVVLSKDGYVLTNNHVVTLDGETSHPDIQVTDDAGNLYKATIVGTDPIYDLAVIKLEDASGMTPMSFGDSSNINVGDTAVAIGAPLGLAGTVTDGIVSALDRSITVASSAVPDNSDDEGQEEDPYQFGLPGQDNSSKGGGYISLAVIQTDAAINPGNSGGALVDDEGKLIGVNVAIASAGSSSSDSQSGSIGVGFAIPSNIAKRIADEIIADGSATHGLLGASVLDAADDENATVSGALIKEATGGGAADEAGLRAGDIITEFDGVPISNKVDITAQVRGKAAGDKATITYVRDGQKYTADVTLDALTE